MIALVGFLLLVTKSEIIDTFLESFQIEIQK